MIGTTQKQPAKIDFEAARARAKTWYANKAPKIFKRLGQNESKFPDWYFNGNYKRIEGIEPTHDQAAKIIVDRLFAYEQS
jgi:hypothetical protein